MFNLTGSEIVVILLLALVVLGPEKLPDAIRRFGRTYAEFKRMSAGFQSEFRSVLEEPVREMRDTADMLGSAASFEPATLEEPAAPEQTAPPDTAPPETAPPQTAPPETAASNAPETTGETGVEAAADTPAPDRDTP